MAIRIGSQIQKLNPYDDYSLIDLKDVGGTTSQTKWTACIYNVISHKAH